jgi:hypothetical protein
MLPNSPHYYQKKTNRAARGAIENTSVDAACYWANRRAKQKRNAVTQEIHCGNKESPSRHVDRSLAA